MTNPVCEECDLEMHPFAFEGTEGYSCAGCGWSYDTVTPDEKEDKPDVPDVPKKETQEEDLRILVRSLFEEYLDYVEIHGSDNHVVRPIGISCSRALMSAPLKELLRKIREKAGLPPSKKTNEELKKEWKL